jgi:excinuclease ABC subunit A
LYENLAILKGQASGEAPGLCAGISGGDQVGSVVLVDQSPLSKTPRSSPAVYLGVFDQIRELFAATDEARARGFTAGTFSFNAGVGRCERCSGSGFERVEMQFLSDVYVRCAECEGRRYQNPVLEIRLALGARALNVHEVLELSVAEALEFFAGTPGGARVRIEEPLRALAEVGLGYLKLGQPLNLLSGGESQRLKLVERLVQGKDRGALLILDEPTTRPPPSPRPRQLSNRFR